VRKFVFIIFSFFTIKQYMGSRRNHALIPPVKHRVKGYFTSLSRSELKHPRASCWRRNRRKRSQRPWWPCQELPRHHPCRQSISLSRVCYISCSLAQNLAEKPLYSGTETTAPTKKASGLRIGAPRENRQLECLAQRGMFPTCKKGLGPRVSTPRICPSTHGNNPNFPTATSH